MIKGRTFYCPIDPASNFSNPTGSLYVTNAQDAIKVATAEINGLNLLLLFTSQSDKRLTDSYVGIEGREALIMSSRMDGIDGAVFQNNDNSWVGLDSQKVKWVLTKYCD